MSDQSYKGTPMLFVDGPASGTIMKTDFHKDEINGAVYRKTTFGALLVIDGKKFRVWLDVAHVGDLPNSLMLDAVPPGGILKTINDET